MNVFGGEAHVYVRFSVAGSWQLGQLWAAAAHRWGSLMGCVWGQSCLFFLGPVLHVYKRMLARTAVYILGDGAAMVYYDFEVGNSEKS